MLPLDGCLVRETGNVQLVAEAAVVHRCSGYIAELNPRAKENPLQHLLDFRLGTQPWAEHGTYKSSTIQLILGELWLRALRMSESTDIRLSLLAAP